MTEAAPGAGGRRVGPRRPAPDSPAALLAGGVERVGQRRGGVGDGPVAGDDVGEAVSGARGVQAPHGFVKAQPQLVGPRRPVSGRSSYGG